MIVETRQRVDAVEYYQAEITEEDIIELNKEIADRCVDGFFFEPLTMEDMKLYYDDDLSTSERNFYTETLTLKRTWGITPSYEYYLSDFIKEYFSDYFHRIDFEVTNYYDTDTYIVED